MLGRILDLMFVGCDWSTERGESIFLVWTLSTLIQQFFDTPLAILIAAQLLCFMVYDLILLSGEYRMKIEYWNLGGGVIYESCNLLVVYTSVKVYATFRSYLVYLCILTI